MKFDMPSSVCEPPASLDCQDLSRGEDSQPIASNPSFVWLDAHGKGRNVFAFFRRTFVLIDRVESAVLHLFADTRYRLFVNGEVIHYGPARFLPTFPEYDSIDISQWLVKGANVIVVEVNSVGAHSYESAPSRGGFIAWGKAIAGRQVIDLATPGDWRMLRCAARDLDAPAYSFAQAAVEILDLSKVLAGLHDPSARLDERWTVPAVVDSSTAWGAFEPRSIPLLARTELIPQRVVTRGALIKKEKVFGFCASGGVASEAGVKLRVPWFTHIHSQTDQQVSLGLFWGPYFLNGAPLKPETDPLRGNRENYLAPLRAGWNFLYGVPEIVKQPWGVLFGIPLDRGLSVAAMPGNGHKWGMAYGPIQAESGLLGIAGGAPASLKDLESLESWKWVAHDALPGFPAREVAWDLIAADGPSFPAMQVSEIEDPRGSSLIVFDLGKEYIGHVIFEMTAPEGTVIDVSNGEVLRADGQIDLFRFNPYTNTTDRVKWAGGRQTVEIFHHRGGRYVQLTIRGEKGAVFLHRLTVRETLYPLSIEGNFACADPLFDWVWRTGTETIRASVVDAFVDPWRERGVYVGDTLVQFHAMRTISSDSALARRCIQLWGRGQRGDGQILDVIPSWKEYALADYSLIWIILVRDYWAATGDVTILSEMWPHIERVFTSPVFHTAPSGLWTVSTARIFGDWGIDLDGRTGETGLLNAFRYRALQCTAEIAQVLGKQREAKNYAAQLPAVERAFQTLWDASRGHFAASRQSDGHLSPSGGLHTNVLALLYGLAEPDQESSVERHILEGLPRSRAVAPGRLELYFLYYALGMFYDRGHVAVAEQIIRDCYGVMHEAGAWTFWEGLEAIGSQCHGWACSPQHFFAERTLGVRNASPGKPDSIIVSPVSATLTWARGVVPHPRGDIHVAWEIAGGRMCVSVRGPRGLEIVGSASPGMPYPHEFSVNLI